MILFSADAVLASSTSKFGIDCSNEATNYSCREYSCGSNGGYDLHPQEHIPCSAKFFVSIFSIIRRRNSGSRMNRSWIPWKTSSCTSSSIGWPYGIPCRPAFLPNPWPWSRLFLMTYSGTERSIVEMMHCWFALFLCARSARTWSRGYKCSSMINILCTAFWVPSRVIHIIRCSQHPESFVLILDWKD